MSGPIHESMTRLQIGRHTIRVWRTEESLLQALEPDNRDLEQWAIDLTRALVLSDDGMPELTATRLYHELEKFPRIAAFEILDENLNGLVVYPEWP